jgi:hypothetical protein
MIDEILCGGWVYWPKKRGQRLANTRSDDIARPEKSWFKFPIHSKRGERIHHARKENTIPQVAEILPALHSAQAVR